MRHPKLRPLAAAHLAAAHLAATLLAALLLAACGETAPPITEPGEVFLDRDLTDAIPEALRGTLGTPTQGEATVTLRGGVQVRVIHTTARAVDGSRYVVAVQLIAADPAGWRLSAFPGGFPVNVGDGAGRMTVMAQPYMVAQRRNVDGHSQSAQTLITVTAAGDVSIQ